MIRGMAGTGFLEILILHEMCFGGSAQENWNWVTRENGSFSYELWDSTWAYETCLSNPSESSACGSIEIVIAYSLQSEQVALW